VNVSVTIIDDEPVSTTRYIYDKLHRISKATYDDGTRIVYNYDNSGNRTQRVLTVLADLNSNGYVNLEDFASFAFHWLEMDCAYPDLCGEADFDWNGEVTIWDLETFASFWLENMD